MKEIAQKYANPKGQEPIAVIGMECIFPKAPNLKAYWQNILNGVNAIGEPVESWNKEYYLGNKTITTAKGGFLKDLYRVNPIEFGVMPNSVDGGEPDQFLALQVAKSAMQDAGNQYLAPDYDHSQTGVILGHSPYLHRGQMNACQQYVGVDQTIDILSAVMPMNEEYKAKIREILRKQLPPSNVDVYPAMVPNVMTGRIANRLNFNGPNYMVDAACASSLLSINTAVEELRSGNCRMMLAGGVNASMPAEVLIVFSELDTLSKTGEITPFSKKSNGTLLGEGLGIVVLKKLSDALEDGDRVYSVIHGVGQSSDGKGMSLLAPNEKGEVFAIQRAYESTGIDPDSISLIEAHGTGIPLGDQTEISSLKTIFGERKGKQGNIAVGSVKSMISHCIPAAGIAGFIKTTLALYHKILPPTLCDELNPDLKIEETSLYVNNQARPWIGKEGQPLRAGVNSFAFGGVNAHAILQEPPVEANQPLKCSAWSAELCIFAANDIADLQGQLSSIKTFIANRDDVKIDDIAYTLFERAKDKSGDFRLAIIAKDADELLKKIEQAEKRLSKNVKPLMGKNGIIFTNKPIEGKLAFMFPGEGSQYINMLSDLAMHFDVVRQWFDFWGNLYNETDGSRRTDIIFPVNSELTDERLKELKSRLHDMDVGSEAVFVAGQAMHDLLKWLGVKPDAMVGHSSGESSALCAARSVPWENHQQLSAFVRKLNKIYNIIEEKQGIERGSLMAIALISKDKIEKHLKDTKIMVAMENCHTQTIVFGDKDSVAKLAENLAKEGAVCELLPFDRGYHTPAFNPMKEAFVDYYKDIDLNAPKVPLYSCASADLFPENQGEVQSLAAAQWISKVRFVETIEKMHKDGVRYFVETGPSGKLASFTEQVLRNNKLDKDCVICASNLEAQTGLSQLLNLVAKLYVNNKVTAEKLFEGREVELVDFEQLQKPKLKGIYLDNTLPRMGATPELVSILQELMPQNNAPQESVVQDLYPDYRPFFTEITELSSSHFVGYSYLSLLDDNFLQDHVISGAVSHDPELFGLSCVPLMATLEMMAEACTVLAGSIDLRVIENIKTFNWVLLDNYEVNLEVRATAIEGANNGFFAEVFNDGEPVMCGNYFFGEQKMHINQPLPALENSQEYPYSGEYEPYSMGIFHGPIFQSVRLVDGLNDNGIDTSLSNVSLEHFFRDGEVAKTIINPVLMDSLNQSTVFWVAGRIGPNFQSFPTKIERIEFYAQCPENVEGLRNIARKQKSISGSDDGVWDVQCVDASGQSIIKMQGLQNVFYKIPFEVYQCRCNPLIGWLGSQIESQWRLPYVDESLLAKSDGLLLKLLANCFLDFDEREEFAQIQEFSLKDKVEWLFPRFCAKEAVRYWISEQTGNLLYPTEIKIIQTADGSFYADGWWCSDEHYLIDAPQISLQQGNGAVVAQIDASDDSYGYHDGTNG